MFSPAHGAPAATVGAARASAGVDIRGEGCLLLRKTPVMEFGGATARAAKVLERMCYYLSVLSVVFSMLLLVVFGHPASCTSFSSVCVCVITPGYYPGYAQELRDRKRCNLGGVPSNVTRVLKSKSLITRGVQKLMSPGSGFLEGPWLLMWSAVVHWRGGVFG